MNHFAYKARNILLINLRKHLSELYCNCGKRVKKIKKTPSKQHGLEKLLVYPAFKKRSEFSLFTNKLYWYLPRNSYSSFTVSTYFTKYSERVNYNINNFADLPNYYQERFDHIIAKKHLSIDELKKAERILIHRASSLLNPIIWPFFDKVFMVDNKFYSTMESTGFASLLQRTFNKEQVSKLNELSCNNFKKLLKLKKEKSYVFLTGPSINEAYKYDYSNGLKIVCNSIIKDRDLMNHIKPDLLVFADPVFHFGPSKYAYKFREMMVEAVTDFDMLIAVPESYMPLLVSHFPQLNERIIGVKLLNSAQFMFPSEDCIAVKGTANILTLLMLPFASALSNCIILLGSDGRQKNENYFWKHNEKVQFNDLMETVFNTHPSFFRDRVYTDYYETHCNLMEDFMDYGESCGLKYFSLTDSYIPALKKRMMERERQ